MRVAAILPAGGIGARMGSEVPKQYLELAGQPILLRSLRRVMEHPRVEWVIVALPPADAGKPPFALPEGVHVVAGGPERTDSVRNALAVLPESADVVLIHDAARPLVPPELLDRALRAVAPDVGVTSALPVSDTLKRVDDGGRIMETVDRRGLWRAQTPQVFPRELILEAHRRAAADGVATTDDAELVERLGGRVIIVRGDPRNLKITRPEDVVLAERLLGGPGA